MFDRRCRAGSRFQRSQSAFSQTRIAGLSAVARLADRSFEMPAFAKSHPFERPGFKGAGAH